MRSAPAARRVLLSIVIAFGCLATPRAQVDPVASLAGTWGQPPIDGQPGLTGSIFTTYKDGRGAARVDLIFAPPDWSCTITDQAVTWNEGERRFEWPNQSLRITKGPCWRKAAAPKTADALTAAERDWRRERHDTCDADRRYSCVKEIYERRIAELRK